MRLVVEFEKGQSSRHLTNNGYTQLQGENSRPVQRLETIKYDIYYSRGSDPGCAI